MVTPSIAIDWRSTSNSTKPTIKSWEVDYSKNPAEIALDELAFSLSDLDPEELIEGFEETRQKVFEQFYCSPGGNN